MFRFISLAPIKYDQRLFDKYFETISIRRHSLLDGTSVYTANAYLKNSLIPAWKNDSQLYSSSDGSGTSVYENEAVYKSISEGIERLAFYQNFDSEKYGFKLDCSTNGLAAFPGIFQSSARRIALIEAIERWSIHQFWEGRLGILEKTGNKGINNIFIRTPFRGIVTVISTYSFEKEGALRRAYGFASGTSEKSTLFRAMIELSRNFEVLTSFDDSQVTKVSGLLEKRLLYFSNEKGMYLFDQKIASARKILSQSVLKPRVIVDESIKGIWTGDCHVHRILFDDTTSASTAEDIFAF